MNKQGVANRSLQITNPKKFFELNRFISLTKQTAELANR